MELGKSLRKKTSKQIKVYDSFARQGQRPIPGTVREGGGRVSSKKDKIYFIKRGGDFPYD